MLHLITGPMFSGKTEELQRLIRRHRAANKKVLTVIPRSDHRSGESFRSHAGRSCPAMAIRDEKELAQLFALGAPPDVLAVDEGQFFPPSFAAALDAYRGHCEILVAALHRDYQGKVFETTQAFFAVAESIQMLTAICHVCYREAAYTYRLVETDGQILVGGAESYEARCWEHWRADL